MKNSSTLRKEEQTCLTCEFEPDWIEDKSIGIEEGDCLWDEKNKLPESIVEYTLLKVQRHDPHKNCKAWRSKCAD